MNGEYLTQMYNYNSWILTDYMNNVIIQVKIAIYILYQYIGSKNLETGDFQQKKQKLPTYKIFVFKFDSSSIKKV